jgi:hypothetical protein
VNQIEDKNMDVRSPQETRFPNPTWEDYLLHPIRSCETMVAKVGMAILSGIVGICTLGLVHWWAGRRIAHRQAPFEGAEASTVKVAGQVFSPPSVIAAAAVELPGNPFADDILRIGRIRDRIAEGPLALGGNERYLYQEFFRVYYGELDVVQSLLQKNAPDMTPEEISRKCLNILKKVQEVLDCDQESIPEQFRDEHAGILRELNMVVEDLNRRGTAE